MRFKIYNFFQMTIIFLVSSCTCKNCGEPEQSAKSRGKGFGFTIVDKKTNIYFYPEGVTNPIFYKDSLKVFNSQNQPVLLSMGRNYFNGNFIYTFSFPYISYTDEFEKKICKTYFLSLNKTDTDTLQICYRLSLNKCNIDYLNDFEITYNNVLQSNTSFNTTNILKK